MNNYLCKVAEWSTWLVISSFTAIIWLVAVNKKKCLVTCAAPFALTLPDCFGERTTTCQSTTWTCTFQRRSTNPHTIHNAAQKAVRISAITYLCRNDGLHVLEGTWYRDELVFSNCCCPLWINGASLPKRWRSFPLEQERTFKCWWCSGVWS